MKAVRECCAAADVARDFLNVCLMTGPADGEPKIELRKFATFNADLDKLREWLTEAGCTHFAMESTGSYWKPVYAALEDSGIAVIVANGEDVKARRGHKTDWQDCQFLANLLRHGLVRPSFIPPQAIRDLRDLTRRRRQLIGDAVSERNRVQKVLEEANVRLGSVLSDVFGVSGRLMLEKLLATEGEPDAAAIANLAQKKARAKIPEIRRSIEGNRMRDHHRRMLRRSLDHLAFLEQQIDGIDSEVREVIEKAGYTRAFELMQSIPGMQEISAAALLAETGADMSVFPTAAHLSSWMGLCPGNRISAGKNSNSSISRGNRWARTALVECAWAASAKKDCQFRERFHRLSVKGRKTRRGSCGTFPRRRNPPHSHHRSSVSGAEPAGTGRTETTEAHPALCAETRQTRHRRPLAPTRTGNPIPDSHRHPNLTSPPTAVRSLIPHPNNPDLPNEPDTTNAPGQFIFERTYKVVENTGARPAAIFSNY